MNEEFSNRLEKAMRIRNIKATELSEKAHVPKSAISQYLSGLYEAKPKSIFKLATALNVSEAWLMGLDVPMEKDTLHLEEPSEPYSYISSQFYMCPVYGRISAGQPNWAEECTEGRIPLAPTLMNIVNPEECFFLIVNGESMNKEIKNGSYALIRKTDFVENGEIAVVLINRNDATLKKFSKQGDLIVLEPMSTDPSFTTQVYGKDTDIKVIGKYIGKFELN